MGSICTKEPTIVIYSFIGYFDVFCHRINTGNSNKAFHQGKITSGKYLISSQNLKTLTVETLPYSNVTLYLNIPEIKYLTIRNCDVVFLSITDKAKCVSLSNGCRNVQDLDYEESIELASLKCK